MNSAPLIGSTGVAMPVSIVISRTDVPLLILQRRGYCSRVGALAFGTIFLTRSAGMSVQASFTFSAAAAYDESLPVPFVDGSLADRVAVRKQPDKIRRAGRTNMNWRFIVSMLLSRRHHLTRMNFLRLNRSD